MDTYAIPMTIVSVVVGTLASAIVWLVKTARGDNQERNRETAAFFEKLAVIHAQTIVSNERLLATTNELRRVVESDRCQACLRTAREQSEER